MEITGNVNKVYLDDIKFVDLSYKESLCVESLKPFEQGEEVIVIATGIFKNNSIELNDGVFFVKKEFIEDFVLRFKQSLEDSTSQSSLDQKEGNS
jgi:hypothetical protein